MSFFSNSMKKAPRSQRQANLPETCIPRSEAPYAPQPADREPSTPAVKTERFPYVLGYNDIGMKIDGHGIFLGEWAPIDRYENEVGTTYYVFAAPHFLSSQYRMPLRLSYNEAVKEVTKLKNWHGFDGTNYKTDAELYSALSDKSYKGGWFIPPIELLRGVRSGHCTEAFKNHLYNVKHCGKFRKDFFDDAPNVLSCTYYSSFGGTVDIMHFGSGRFSQAFDYKSGYYCRPMRVVPAP